MLRVLLFYTFSLVSLLLYYTFMHIDIRSCTVDNSAIELPYLKKSGVKKSYIYRCTLDTRITKDRLISIVADDTIEQIKLNGNLIDLTHHKTKYSQQELSDYIAGYQFVLPLVAHENSIEVHSFNKGGPYSFNVEVGMLGGEYLLLFILFVVPFMYASYRLFFILLSRFKSLVLNKKWLYALPFIIIFIGVMLRVNLLVNTNNDMYQHDGLGHKEMIEFYAKNGLDFPQPDKALQAPQQPLYYIISSTIYSTSISLGFTQDDAFYAIRSVSVLYAFGTMVVGYFLVLLFTRKRAYVSMFVAFLSLTPSFVFLGARINNDSLNALIGIMILYFTLSYFKHPSQKKFIYLLMLIPIAILTKISSLLFALMLLFVLFLHYFYYAKKTDRLFNKSVIEQRAFMLSLSVIFVFMLALLKAYIPSLNEFVFVNSGLYSRQILPALDLTYFFSFNWFDLIKEAQSYVFGKDSIRHSFLTYQYGTMLTSEYTYSQYYTSGSFFKLVTQGIYLFGIIYVIALMAYLVRFKKLTPLKKLLIFPVVINLLLVIKFLSSYWSICNSDFRYYTPIFGAIGLIFVLGTKEILEFAPKLQKPFTIALVLFFTLQIIWSLYIVKVTI